MMGTEVPCVDSSAKLLDLVSDLVVCGPHLLHGVKLFCDACLVGCNHNLVIGDLGVAAYQFNCFADELDFSWFVKMSDVLVDGSVSIEKSPVSNA